MKTNAQELLADHAPIEIEKVDFEIFKKENDELETTVSDIYFNWSNKGITDAKGILPLGFKVDLRNYVMPTKSQKITSKYGKRWGRKHNGVDVKVYIGDTIYSAFSGKVRLCKYNGGGYGYYIVIRHPNGLETLYGHLSKQLVRENQTVYAGQPIGLGGNTGRSTGSHLHFETRLLGVPIDPSYMFDFVHQDVTGDFYIVKK